ncbi:unnamed protein product [Sphenostylis stenocarpa]|uniref:Uncharacterized protein n=1 Tax=Sphenostylis stenocarpa TaxID=92480 RepID=A0AA86SFM2_9FABA|nr:unnamed protein product [Sphenostylis stenocarpa]
MEDLDGMGGDSGILFLSLNWRQIKREKKEREFKEDMNLKFGSEKGKWKVLELKRFLGFQRSSPLALLCG